MRRRVTLAVTMLLLTLVLPLSVAAQPPAPVVRHLFRTAGIPVPGPFEVAHNVLDFAPGAITPQHTHPGLVLVTVTEGEVTFRNPGLTPDNRRVYKVGESFIEQPGVVGEASNAGAVRASLVASFLLPQGAPLSTAAPPMPGLPATGMGGAARWPTVWLALLAGGGLLATGWAIRRAGRVR